MAGMDFEGLGQWDLTPPFAVQFQLEGFQLPWVLLGDYKGVAWALLE